MKSPTALAAALLCALAFAAPADWSREPADVMGIRLGAPLEGAGIPPCDASNEVQGRISTTALCFHPRAATGRPDQAFFTVHNAPDLGAGRQQVVLDVAHGRVAGILLTGSAARFAQVVAVLEARYGAATETLTGSERTRSDVPAPALTKRWRGERVTIEAISPFGRTGEFTVYWADVTTQEQRDAQRSRESAGIASKL